MILCVYCNTNQVGIKTNGKPKQYCSMACQSKHTVERRKVTWLKKYGTENPMLLDSTKEKRKQTNIDRYGTDIPFNTPEVQDKFKATCLARYGVEHSSQSDVIKNKQKIAWGKYNNSHPLSDSEVRARCDDTMQERYGVLHPIQHPEIKKKIEDTLLSIYGVSNAAKAEEVKRKISSTHTNGASTFLDDSTWMQEMMEVIGQRGISELLNVSTNCVRNYCDKHSIVFRKIKSAFEEEVYLYIKGLLPADTIIDRNTKAIIDGELDIYLPQHQVAIECNGTYWHSELNGRTKSYHNKKTQECNNINVHLMHIWEHEWMQNKDIIKSRIAVILGKGKKIPARKTTVQVVTKKEAAIFLNENHIQSSCNSTVNLGLHYEGTLVSIMTFGKPRFSKNEYELIRFCTTKNTIVVGGASKLFTHFLRTLNPGNIISYSDRAFNTGGLYHTLGFSYAHKSPPSYKYTKDYFNMENRVKYQKHKLSKLLEIYDPALSEWDNMKQNGFDRIWDCGTDVWIWSDNSLDQGN
jgi:hypothetical protein